MLVRLQLTLPSITETYGVDVLALELRDELGEAVLVSLNADGGENLLDVISRRGGVAADHEEEVCSNITHLPKRKQFAISYMLLRE